VFHETLQDTIANVKDGSVDIDLSGQPGISMVSLPIDDLKLIADAGLGLGIQFAVGAGEVSDALVGSGVGIAFATGAIGGGAAAADGHTAAGGAAASGASGGGGGGGGGGASGGGGGAAANSGASSEDAPSLVASLAYARLAQNDLPLWDYTKYLDDDENGPDYDAASWLQLNLTFDPDALKDITDGAGEMLTIGVIAKALNAQQREALGLLEDGTFRADAQMSAEQTVKMLLPPLEITISTDGEDSPAFAATLIVMISDEGDPPPWAWLLDAEGNVASIGGVADVPQQSRQVDLRVVTLSYGKDRLASLGTTEEDHAQNRRTVITIEP
jgi:hypothetical protein